MSLAPIKSLTRRPQAQNKRMPLAPIKSLTRRPQAQNKRMSLAPIKSLTRRPLAQDLHYPATCQGSKGYVVLKVPPSFQGNRQFLMLASVLARTSKTSDGWAIGNVWMFFAGIKPLPSLIIDLYHRVRKSHHRFKATFNFECSHSSSLEQPTIASVLALTTNTRSG